MAAKTKSPAFQWYPRDILSSARVAEMSLAEEGAYRRLIDHCWLNGSIPADPVRVSRIVGKNCSKEIAQNILGMFTQHPSDPTRLIHDRLEVERKKQQEVSEKRKKSANARWYGSESDNLHSEDEENCAETHYEVASANIRESKQGTDVTDIQQVMDSNKDTLQCNANAMQTQCKSNANDMQMVCIASSTTVCKKERNIIKKERKQNETKNDNKTADFNKKAEQIWRAYPKKDGKKQGIKAILAKLKEGYSAEYLIERVNLYKIERKGHEAYTMNAQGWFNQERFLDESLDALCENKAMVEKGNNQKTPPNLSEIEDSCFCV